MKKNILQLLFIFLLVSVMSMNSANQYSLSFADDGKVETVEIIEDFNDGIDPNYWKVNEGFGTKNKVLRSIRDKTPAKLELKGDYSTYEHIKMSVELVNISAQTWAVSNGGIGISGGDNIWVFNERMEYGTDFRGRKRDWFRNFEISQFSDANNIIESHVLDREYRPSNNWINRSIKLEIDAVKLSDTSGYDITTKVYREPSKNGDYELIGEVSRFYGIDKVDFSKIYLADIVPEDGWYVEFDNFYLKASKEAKFESLNASWEDDVYTLSWTPIATASAYEIYFEDIGSDKIYTVNEGEDVSDGIVAIADNQTVADKVFYVVAELADGSKVKSNKVKLAGDIGRPFELTGKFNGNHYVIDYQALDISGTPTFDYTLFYGSDNLQITRPLKEKIPSVQTRITINDVMLNDAYYNKYMTLVANVDFGLYGVTKFYSNDVLTIDDLRLELTHVDGLYIFNWETTRDYDSYDLFRDTNEVAVANPTIATDKDHFRKTSLGQIATFSVLDTDLAYKDKYFMLQGDKNGVEIKSNVVKMDSSILLPILSWEENGAGHQTFAWENVNGASKVELYSGEKANAINTWVSKDKDLSLDTSYHPGFWTSSHKYAQLRIFKDGVWYYSNIVRTQAFDLDKVQVLDVALDEEDATEEKVRRDLVFEWTGVEWPEDSDLGELGSRYELYYLNDDASRNILVTGYSDKVYTIEDIYGKAANYLNKSFYIESYCTIIDEFGIERKLVVASEEIIPRKISFDKLSGQFDDNRDYTIAWEKPVELDVDTQTISVSSYQMKYGANLSAIATLYLNELKPPYSDLELQPIQDVKKDGSGSKYYHKYFALEAVVDNVVYKSNEIYTEDTVQIKVHRFDDDFTLFWNEIENADKIKLYYADGLEGDYVLYKPVTLGGDSKKHTLKDLDGENKVYDQKYFKIRAEFGDYKLDSNAVQLKVNDSLPVIEGEYMGGDDYEVKWTLLPWVSDGYQLYYEEKNEETETVSYKVIDKSFSNFDDRGTLSVLAYNNKYVRLAAIKGDLLAFSNRKLVKDPTFKGQLEGVFNKEDVRLKLGNSADISYTFKVYKEMKVPYFKVVFDGSKYLVFDKMTASLSKSSGSSSSAVDVKLVTDVDEANGIVTLYVHPLGDDSTFTSSSSISYKLNVLAGVAVNDRNVTELYQGLRSLDETFKNWSLPYHVEDIKIDGDQVDDGMSVRFETHWNVLEDTPMGDQRETHEVIFDTILNIINKKQLPGSM